MSAKIVMQEILDARTVADARHLSGLRLGKLHESNSFMNALSSMTAAAEAVQYVLSLPCAEAARHVCIDLRDTSWYSNHAQLTHVECYCSVWWRRECRWRRPACTAAGRRPCAQRPSRTGAWPWWMCACTRTSCSLAASWWRLLRR